MVTFKGKAVVLVATGEAAGGMRALWRGRLVGGAESAKATMVFGLVGASTMCATESPIAARGLMARGQAPIAEDQRGEGFSDGPFNRLAEHPEAARAPEAWDDLCVRVTDRKGDTSERGGGTFKNGGPVRGVGKGN